MYEALRSYFRVRAALRREAEELVAEHGVGAARIARQRAAADRDAGDYLTDAALLVAMVDRKLGAEPRADTATRYLDDGKGRGQYPWL